MIHKLIVYIKAARFGESALMLGFPLIGFFFAVEPKHIGLIWKVPAFLVITYGLVIYVYLLNSWGGVKEDIINRRLMGHPVLTGEMKSQELLWGAIGGLIVAILGYSLLFRGCLWICLAIAGVWTLYSHPKVMLKAKPVTGSFCHFFGGILQFLLGWAAMAPAHSGAWLISFYFSAIFTAGHLNHEVKDYEDDKVAGLRTNAVEFGPARVLAFSFWMFAAAFVYLIVLAIGKVAAWIDVLPFLLAFPIHYLWHLAKGKPTKVIYDVAYQQGYRALFFAAGSVLVLIRLIQRM